MTNLIIKRIGLILYGVISILESFVNAALYLTCLDIMIKPVDWAFPFYFKYVDHLLKGIYLSNLKKNNGKDV